MVNRSLTAHWKTFNFNTQKDGVGFARKSRNGHAQKVAGDQPDGKVAPPVSGLGYPASCR